MKWEKDLTKDIRTHSSVDDIDGGIIPHPRGYSHTFDSSGRVVYPIEVTECNRVSLLNKFEKIKDKCNAILEIGIARNNEESFCHVFLKNKKKDCIYVGIDIEDRSFIDDKEKNIYTIKDSSSNYVSNLEKFKELGIDKFDFIFIDGWHSINQVLIDWEYTNLLSDHGIVGLHDTSCHPGPYYFIKNLDLEKWEVEKNCCPDDWGIGFAWQKKSNTNDISMDNTGIEESDILSSILHKDQIDFFINESKNNPYTRFFDIERDDVVFDIGTCIGTFTDSALENRAKEVHCFEPHSDLYNYLKKKYSKNNNVFVNNGAFAHSPEYIKEEITLDLMCNTSGISKKQKVKRIDFMDYVKSNNINKIDFLKTDCEGGEWSIFVEGNCDWICNNVRKVSGEFHLEFKPENVVRFILFREMYLKRAKNVQAFFINYDGSIGNDCNEIWDDVFVIRNLSYLNISFEF